MPRNGSGVYSPPGANYPAVSGTVITAANRNAVDADIATALTGSIAVNGESVVTANIPLGGNKLTGVGAATARTDAATLATIQDGTGIYVATVGGTADVITLTPSPAIAAYVAGQTFKFIAGGTNTTNVTVAISGLAAKAITKNGTTALVAGDITSGALVEISYDGTRFQLETGAGLGSNTFSGVQNWAQGSDIASAATINLTTATGNFINITGTTGISTVTLGNGMWRMVKFAGACLLTYSATTNKLNTGGVDYTTSAGDMVLYAAGDGIINGTIYPASGSAVIPPTVPVIAAGAISRSTNATGFNTTPAKIGFNTSEASNNLTVDTGNSRLTIDVDGTYEVIINAPASSSAGVATGTIYLYKNGSSIKSVTGGTTGAANYSVHGTLLATPTLVAGDYLETYFSMSTGSGTIYARAIMTAKKIY